MVEETYNYVQFKLSKYNRDIKENNLARIDRNVKKNGWRKLPITVNEKYEVIDGQHRLVYAKEHNLPVYYVVVKGLRAQDCVTMNNVRASWAVEDYIKLYASEGNEDYKRLQGLLSRYTFTTANTICAIAKGSIVGGSGSSKIKSGEYTFSKEEYERIKAKLDFLEELAPYVRSARGRTAGIYLAISFCYDHPDISNERLKKQVKEKIGSITPPADTEMAFKELEYIYNYKIPKENYRYIFTEYKKYAKERMLHGEKGGLSGRK